MVHQILLNDASEAEQHTIVLSTTSDEVWFIKAGYGAACARRKHGGVSVYADPKTRTEDLRASITHEWQPLFRQVFGTQVIHASAVLHSLSRTLLLLAGPTHSGKSTLAFGMQRRPQWRQLADDFIGFRLAQDDIQIVPLPNLLRLRPRNAEFFGRPALNDTMIERLESELQIVVTADRPRSSNTPDSRGGICCER